MRRAEIHFEVLPAGLPVLLRATRLAPVVELQFWTRVGSADEGDLERGLAHFHEHMLFKGTARRGVGELAGEIEGAGGRINAYTTFDTTVYHATLPSDRLDVGIDVLSDAVLHSVFDPAEIKREIEVVLEEIRRGEDAPGNVLGDAVFAEAYRVHPYRAPILGNMESVASFDHERVRSFYERWYTPENLFVVAAGDFDTAALIGALNQAFAGARVGRAVRRRPVEPEQTALRTRVLARPFERTSISLLHPTVAFGHPDAPYLDLLAFVLGNCESSRLVRRVKERDALVDRIDAYSYTPLDAGVSSVDIDTDAARATAAIEASVREIERMRAELVSREEIEKARVNFLASEHFERESVSGMAAKIGGFHAIGGGWQNEQRYFEAVRSASPRDLQRVARQYLAPERLTVGVLLPEQEAHAVDDAAIVSAVARGVERSARAFSAPLAVDSRTPDLLSYELCGGAQLHVLPRRDVPVVAARAALLGGLLAEDAQSSGHTAFLTSMWLRGTRSHASAGFATAVESLAAEINTFSGRSSFGLTLEAPSEQLDAALDLFTEVLLEPAFDRQELERERAETLAAIERREDRLAQRAFLLFAEHHYRHHPYRMPTLGSAAAIRALNGETLRAHHARLVKTGNLVVAIAGDVDPDRVARQLAARLSELDASAFEAPDPPPEELPREIRRAELRKDRAQAHLVIGFRGVTVFDEDRFALEVIAQLLAGQGGRLFIDLRDRRGLAYAVNAVSVEGVAPGYFALYIATAPEKLDEARGGLLAEIERVHTAPASALELERARRYLTGSYAIDQQRNAVHAAQISLNARYGLGADAGFRYAEQMSAVSSDDVQRVARRILDLDTYTEAIIRP
ncbi:MAG: insulinase family protein [Myxococcales bacterium]|nr:insulinase family protein [Myxococcales bacterium]